MYPYVKKNPLTRCLAGRFTIALLLLGMMSVASAQTIKLATIVPEGSAWMNSMRAGAIGNSPPMSSLSHRSRAIFRITDRGCLAMS